MRDFVLVLTAQLQTILLKQHIVSSSAVTATVSAGTSPLPPMHCITYSKVRKLSISTDICHHVLRHLVFHGVQRTQYSCMVQDRVV
jgi:hypothetical protein